MDRKCCTPSKCLIFLLMMLVCSNWIHAQERKDSLLAERIRFIQESLQNDQNGTRIWWYSWLGIYGAATIGQGAAGFSSSGKSDRQDMALGAATTFLGIAGQFISPFRSFSFDDQTIKLFESTLPGREKRLAELERLLSDRALMEKTACKWQAHILPTSVNLASGLITWIGFHRTLWDGVVNFGLNCVLTESQIWSQPIRAKRALRHYREQFDKDGSACRPHADINFNFIVSAGGAGVRVVF